ncbi:hypothetical protein GZ77_04215 [Endozoicomonas montiporae]|uniref:Ancillary SecYEG translocon subunit n=2 Tax=Endozoicomonas montiporae TaxID=1027273 RepID=A0A081NBD8_9GAMM|nr:tetratricopeptide repeat protein [Endozoicomonas montiporae]AMO56037.1 hypothetical protein EZMO1_1898 [Endozoicomonas montiporae CL-33]KEQ15761.1 hypothetical protein GZ77_04215 [Endozoicomonas montiporae]
MNRTDEEEIELLKRVWSEYGKPAVYGVAITMAVIFGYKGYQKHQYETASAASALYQNLLEATQAGQMAQTLSEDQKSTMTHVVSSLQDDYSGTRYASFATMIQAQQQVLENDLDSARASLEWVLNNKPEAEVEQVARARLARVILGQGDEHAQAALDVLAKAKADEAFVATVEGVRGDAYVALGQLDQARDAYQKALDAARDHGESLPILQFKLDDLAANVQEG